MSNNPTGDRIEERIKEGMTYADVASILGTPCFTEKIASHRDYIWRNIGTDVQGLYVSFENDAAKGIVTFFKDSLKRRGSFHYHFVKDRAYKIKILKIVKEGRADIGENPQEVYISQNNVGLGEGGKCRDRGKPDTKKIEIAKSKFYDFTADQVEGLKKAAKFKPGARLRTAASASMFMGGLAFFIGVNTSQANPVNAGLVAIGALLIAEGFYLQARPSAWGLILDAVALCMLAGWNIFIFAMDSDLLFGGIGAVQVVMAFQSIALFRSTRGEWPDKSALHQLAKLRKHVKDAKPKKIDNIIDFGIAHVGLFEQFAIVVPLLGSGITIVPRDQVAILSCEQLPKNRKLITAMFADKDMTVKLTAEKYDTLAAWVTASERKTLGSQGGADIAIRAASDWVRTAISKDEARFATPLRKSKLTIIIESVLFILLGGLICISSTFLTHLLFDIPLTSKNHATLGSTLIAYIVTLFLILLGALPFLKGILQIKELNEISILAKLGYLMGILFKKIKIKLKARDSAAVRLTNEGCEHSTQSLGTTCSIQWNEDGSFHRARPTELHAVRDNLIATLHNLPILSAENFEEFHRMWSQRQRLIKKMQGSEQAIDTVINMIINEEQLIRRQVAGIVDVVVSGECDSTKLKLNLWREFQGNADFIPHWVLRTAEDKFILGYMPM
jgi:hypothetical protein